MTIESLWEYLNDTVSGDSITLGYADENLPMMLRRMIHIVYGNVQGVELCNVCLTLGKADNTILVTGTCDSVFCEEITDCVELRIEMQDEGKWETPWISWVIVWKNSYKGGAGDIGWMNRWPAYPSIQVKDGMFVHGEPVLAGSRVVSYVSEAAAESEEGNTSYGVSVQLDMTHTELFQKYGFFLNGCSSMSFYADLPSVFWHDDIATIAFISEPFNARFLFPVFAEREVHSAEMRVIIKTAVYDQMSAVNWAEAGEEERVSAAWFVFALEEPESHGFGTLSMEAFSEDESGCIDFYAEKAKFWTDESDRIRIVVENDRLWDMALVSEVLGAELLTEVYKQIEETGEVLPYVSNLLGLRGVVEVCNLMYRYGFGEKQGELIIQNIFMDMRLGSRGENMFWDMSRTFCTKITLESVFFHFEVVFREGATVCCSVRNLAELVGGSTLVYDASDGDFSLCWRPEPRPLSEFEFPYKDLNFQTINGDLAEADRTVERGAADSRLRVENFTLQGNFRARTVYAALALSMENILKLSIGSLQLELKEITGYISIQEQDMGFGIRGLAEITLTEEERASLMTEDDTDCFALSVGGAYEQSQWSMYASLAYGKVSLAGLIRRITGIQIPEGYDLQITKLSVFFQRQKGYQVECELDGTIPVLDMELKAGAQISDLKPQPRKVQLYGQLSLLGFLFTARVELSEGSSRLFFELTFDGADLIAEASGNQIVITIKEISVGALIRAFYRVIRPNVDYSLPEPWSLLNRVGLSDVVITFDRENQVVTVVKKLHINLLVAQITGIGFQYVWGEADPDRERFEIILDTDGKSGEILPERSRLGDGIEDGPLRGFMWDALHDNAPVLFQGGEVFALHYFVLGRNVFLGKVEKDGKLRDILSQLRQNLSGQGAVYDAQTGWMICADFTIAKCLSLCILIYDPWIYGAQITVESDTAAGLKGLDLTLYYRKVTEAIGVFYLHAQLPDAVRKVDLGGISFTLPVIEIWLYTNGDFKVNLGFPENRDFSQSFTFSYGIYSGSGGLYFGKLSGDTSSKVPVIVNGYFTPVVEIGIGIKFRVGKALDFGILKLKACLEITGIFEGVFAVFRPKDERQKEDLYYKCTALVEVSAELSGTVDFFVIKAGFHIYARMQVLVTLEAHEPVLIGMEAELSVKACLKILFITVQFSFSFTYRDTFVLGEKSAAPWILEQADALPVKVRAQMLDAGDRYGRQDGMISWDERTPFVSPEQLTCLVTPYFTAKQILLREKSAGRDISGEEKHRGITEDWQIVILSTLTKESFDILVKGLARRALYAASGGQDQVTLGQLYGLRETLNEARDSVFLIEILEKFFCSVFRVGLCVPEREAWEGQMEDGAVIPLFPQLVLTWYTQEAGGLMPVTRTTLMDNHPLSDEQIADMRAYFAHFEAESEQINLLWERSAKAEQESGTEAIRTKGACATVFEDYCFMLTRQCLLDVIRRLEEEAGAVSAVEMGAVLDRSYPVTELSDTLSFEQYRGMANRFLLGGARLPLSMEKETENQTVFWPLYGLMGLMFASVSEEKALGGPEPVHRLVITKNGACDCSWIDFAYGGFQEERLYVIQREEGGKAEEIETEDILVLDILKEELEYPAQELGVSFVRGPAQFPNVRQEKIPLLLQAGRQLYHDSGQAELWKLPLPMTELGEDIRLGFGGQDNLVKGVHNTADYILGVTLPFELLRDESYVNCIAIHKVPEETLTLLQQVREYTWEDAALLLPSPVQDNHGTDPVTDGARNQALSLLRCNLSQRTRPAGERIGRTEKEKDVQMETLASIKDLGAFLELLFQMGQVGGKGQYLIFGVNPPDASYYAEDGTCQVELLLTCGKEQRKSCINALIFQRPEGESGEPILFGAGIPSQALVVMKQGVAGFSFSLKDPDMEKDITNQERRTRQAFSLLHYRKKEDALLGGAYDSMPVSMQEGEEGEWEYRVSLAVYRFGEKEAENGLPPASENPYRGVLEPENLQLSLFFTDVCGNPALGADGDGLSLSLRLLYTDELIGISAWPDTSCSYQIASAGNGKFLFRLLVEFGDDKTREEVQTGRGEESRPDRERCALLYYQLHQPDTSLALQFTLSGTEEIQPGGELLALFRTYSAGLYTYACGGDMPEGIRYEIELPKAPATKRPRPVRAQLAIARNSSRVQKDAPLPMGEKVLSEIPPYRDFALFCEQLEKTFAGKKFCVKLAKGREGLYAVYFGQGGCQIQAGIEETGRGLLAQKPFSLSLQHRENIGVVHLDDTVEERSFYGVDLDLWLSGFLHDLEHVLSAEKMEQMVSDRECLQILAALAKVKRGFAKELPKKMTGLFGEVEQELLEDARYALCEELAEDLSKSFRITGIMAYPREDREDTMHFLLSTQRADVGLQKIERGRAAVVFTMPEYQKALKEVSLSGTDVVFTHAELPGEGWFSFVRPFHTVEPYAQITLEQDAQGNPVVVPVIVREYPDIPLLTHHQGTMDDAVTLSSFTWSYQAGMRLKPVAQDRIYVTLIINGAYMTAAQNQEEDLFGTLARYDTVRNEILAALDVPSMRKKALDCFHDLALDVLRHLNEEPAEQNLVRETLLMQAAYSGEKIVRYVLQWESGQNFLQGFPLLVVTDPAGNRAEMRPQEEPGGRAVYSLEEFPQVQVDFREGAGYELLFEKLPLQQVQAMGIQVSSTRNEAFMLPGYGEKKVLPAFVYRTEEVSFPQMVSPLGSYEDEVDMGIYSRERCMEAFAEISRHFQLQFTVYLQQILYEAREDSVRADFPICFGVKKDMGEEALTAFFQTVDEWLGNLPQRSGRERVRVSVQCYSKELAQERLLLEWKNLIFVL